VQVELKGLIHVMVAARAQGEVPRGRCCAHAEGTARDVRAVEPVAGAAGAGTGLGVGVRRVIFPRGTAVGPPGTVSRGDV